MLTGKQVRVRSQKGQLLPQYINPRSRDWLDVAEQLLAIYRSALGRTRSEIEAEMAELFGEGPQVLVHEGLAKLLEDRCEFEIGTDLPPDELRDRVFREAATERAANASTGTPFDREQVLRRVASSLQIEPLSLERALFADLRGEQRVLEFKDIPAEQLLHRYNVALAQAVMLRSVAAEVRIWGETPARFRQLFRAVKFHRLICTVGKADGNSYRLEVSGPLSLFSATQKYGLQLALFLPTILHCQCFELKADVRWGPDKKPMRFQLNSEDGLKSTAPDWGMFQPKEYPMLAANLAKSAKDWQISTDPEPMDHRGVLWVPDFVLTHQPTGKTVYLELLGYWRKVELDQHHSRLRQAYPGQFLIAAAESMCTDEKAEQAVGPEVYHYKRMPIAGEIIKRATALIGS